MREEATLSIVVVVVVGWELLKSFLLVKVVVFPFFNAINRVESVGGGGSGGSSDECGRVVSCVSSSSGDTSQLTSG